MAIATTTSKDGIETIFKSLSKVCLTEELADVHFTFPKEGVPSIPGHKMILSLRSPVFKAMFYGTFPQEEGNVKILDIKANTFKMLIRYMYTDEVDISGSSVMALLYAAQKYQLVSLLSKCDAYLSKQLSAVNACTIYAQAKFFSMHQLQAVLPSGVLTDEEQLHIFKVITLKDKHLATEGSKFRMCSRKGIVTLPVKKIIPFVEESSNQYRGDVPYHQRVLFSQFMGSPMEGQDIHLRPNSNITVVSLNIKPRWEYDHFPSKTNFICRFNGEIFQKECRQEESLKLEINRDVTSGQIVIMNFSFECDDHLQLHVLNTEWRVEKVPENYYKRYCMGSAVPLDGNNYQIYNQRLFSYTYNWSDGMYIDFEFSGVHLVDSIDVYRL